MVDINNQPELRNRIVKCTTTKSKNMNEHDKLIKKIKIKIKKAENPINSIISELIYLQFQSINVSFQTSQYASKIIRQKEANIIIPLNMVSQKRNTQIKDNQEKKNHNTEK